MSESHKQPEHKKRSLSWVSKVWSVEIEQNLNSGIYYDSSLKDFNNKLWIGRYGDFIYANEQETIKVYETLWVNIVECADGEAITSNLKLFFAPYEASYLDLWKLNDWSKFLLENYREMMSLCSMISEWFWKDKSYTWYIRQGDDSFYRVNGIRTICVRLPLLANGRLIRMRCSLASSQVSFDIKDNRACPIAIFKP